MAYGILAPDDSRAAEVLGQAVQAFADDEGISKYLSEDVVRMEDPVAALGVALVERALKARSSEVVDGALASLRHVEKELQATRISTPALQLIRKGELELLRWLDNFGEAHEVISKLHEAVRQVEGLHTNLAEKLEECRQMSEGIDRVDYERRELTRRSDYWIRGGSRNFTMSFDVRAELAALLSSIQSTADSRALRALAENVLEFGLRRLPGSVWHRKGS